MAGAQVDGTESGENFGVWEGGCACGLIRPRVRPIRVRPGERELSTSLDLPLALPLFHTLDSRPVGADPQTQARAQCPRSQRPRIYVSSSSEALDE